MDPTALATTYPDRLACYPGPWTDLLNSSSQPNTSCTTATQTMIDFLNLTEFTAYRQAYCLNPPSDSCAFGYCGNPDIASPGFRIASYVCAICLSVVILFSNEEAVQDALYAQLLSTYSYILAAIIAIKQHNITRLHAVFVLQMTGSPLSFYLVVAMLNSILTKHNGYVATWRRKPTNRILVLALVPLWAAVLTFVALPSSISQFQQANCDFTVLDDHAARILLIPIAVFFNDRSRGFTIFNMSILAAIILTWAVCIYWQRLETRKLMVAEGRNRLTATWHAVVNAYPFIQFITLVIYPTLYWIFTLEVAAVFSDEQFSPSYGQLLAIFIAVPPLLHTLPLIPRIGPWFINLTWVRLLTCRRRKSRNGPPLPDLGKYHALDSPKESVSDVKPDLEATYSPTDHVELEGLVRTTPSSPHHRRRE